MNEQRMPTPAGETVDKALACVREALVAVRFGSVAITVHDGRVVQIDVTEKKRLTPQ